MISHSGSCILSIEFYSTFNYLLVKNISQLILLDRLIKIFLSKISLTHILAFGAFSEWFRKLTYVLILYRFTEIF